MRHEVNILHKTEQYQDRLGIVYRMALILAARNGASNEAVPRFEVSLCF